MRATVTTDDGADDHTVEWRDGFGAWASIPKAEILGAVSTGVSGHPSGSNEADAHDDDDVAGEWNDGLGNWATS